MCNELEYGEWGKMRAILHLINLHLTFIHPIHADYADLFNFELLYFCSKYFKGGFFLENYLVDIHTRCHVHIHLKQISQTYWDQSDSAWVSFFCRCGINGEIRRIVYGYRALTFVLIFFFPPFENVLVYANGLLLGRDVDVCRKI